MGIEFFWTAYDYVMYIYIYNMNIHCYVENCMRHLLCLCGGERFKNLRVSGENHDKPSNLG